MGVAYRTVKATWRLLIPKRLYRRAFNGDSWISRRILAVKGELEKTASHNELYDDQYYATMDAEMAIPARGMAESVLAYYPNLKNGTALDVGCGNGAVLAELNRLGMRVAGLEYSDAAIKRARAKGLDVHKFDLEGEVKYDQPADLVLSTEVAEHLPESCADRYVDLMTRAANSLIVMTAATPGQGGTDHVNEQPNSYWINKLEARGFRHNPEMTETLRKDWATRGVDRHRSSNVMVFERMKMS